MKCTLCSKISKYYCPCSDVFLCKKDLIQHLDAPGNHQIEKLKLLSPEELKSKNEILVSRIASIRSAKSKIISETKDAIILLESYAKKEIETMDELLKEYLYILGITESSKAQNQVIQKVINNPLELKNIKLDLNSHIESAFYDKKNHLNNLSLAEKKNILEKAIGLSFATPNEILFSNQSEYAFFCKLNVGNSKQDYSNSHSIGIWKMLSTEKKCDWYGNDDDIQKIQEAVKWFRKYPECFAKIGNWIR